MKKQYIVRGEPVTVEEVEGVRAFSPGISRGLVENNVEKARLEELPNTNPQVVADGWKPFEEAGWMLVNDSANFRAFREKSGEAFAAADEPNAGRVFLHPTGKILVSNGTLTIKLKPELNEESAQQKLEKLDLAIVQPLRFAKNLYQVKSKNNSDYLDLSVELYNDPDIVYAEPGFVENIGSRFTPTDPEYKDQWHLKNTGQSGGIPGADISAEKAWDKTKGGGIKIAIVDNGFSLSHKDLTKSVSNLSGFFKEDVSSGRTIFQQQTTSFPDADHGTFCAGMAIARADNNLNGCGVAPEADFIAVACLGDQVGSQATLARAIAYAASPATENPAFPKTGADVISCSLGPNGADWEMQSVLEDAIDFAVTEGRNKKGTPVFWAVTNGNFPISKDKVCSHKNVIAVGRSTNKDTDDGCGFGPELKFLATGVRVLSTTSQGGTRISTGTSFAAPVAAGVAGLMLSANPGLSVKQVLKAMINTCDKIGGVTYDQNGHHDKYGFGRVNADKAVARASQREESSLASA